MPNYATQFVFLGAGAQGWRETWYQKEVGGLTAAQNNGILFANERVKLLGTPCVLESITTWDVAASGFRLLATVNLRASAIRPVPPPTDTAWNAIRVRIPSEAGRHRHMWLRGVPDSWITYSNVDASPLLDNALLVAGWSGFINAVKTRFVGGSPFAMRIYDRSQPPLFVGGVALAAGATRPVITLVAHGFAADELVKVYGLRGTNVRALNRRGNVVVLTPDTFVLRQVVYPVGTTLIREPGTGQVKRINWLYDFLNFAGAPTVTDFRKRDTGRAIGVSRGRARKQPPLFT